MGPVRIRSRRRAIRLLLRPVRVVGLGRDIVVFRGTDGWASEPYSGAGSEHVNAIVDAMREVAAAKGEFDTVFAEVSRVRGELNKLREEHAAETAA